MREIITEMRVTVDGFIEGPTGEADWVGGWDDNFGLLSQIDALVLGSRLYGVYEQYWRAVSESPDHPLPITGKAPSREELTYLRFAESTPHFVLSKTMEKVAWPTTRIIRDIGVVRDMKKQPGKAIYAVGGATLISSLLNLGLLDEIRLVVCPLLLGGGLPLFKDLSQRHALRLVRSQALRSGRVGLVYRLE